MHVCVGLFVFEIRTSDIVLPVLCLLSCHDIALPCLLSHDIALPRLLSCHGIALLCLLSCRLSITIPLFHCSLQETCTLLTPPVFIDLKLSGSVVAPDRILACLFPAASGRQG